MDLLRTPLHDRHRALGARLVPFAGWDMPVQYAGIIAEHRAVRQGCGLFDVSHMGELAVRGPQAAAAVDRLCANDPRGLVPGRALYTPLCAVDGGTIDDAVLYCRSASDFLFVVNAANREGDAAWMAEQLAAAGLQAQVHDESADTGLLALQGPQAPAIAARAGAPSAVTDLGPFHCVAAEVAGVPVLAARTGYTGEDGFEFACPWGEAPQLWDALLGAGAVPCGLGARDTLRLEAALPLYGHELSREISPLEARLGRFVSVAGRSCVGGEALARLAAQGAPRRLAGLLPEPPAIARAGTACYDAHGAPLGVVTSGSHSPTLGRAVALALLGPGAPEPGGIVTLDVRGRSVPAAVVALPFYRRRRPRTQAGKG